MKEAALKDNHNTASTRPWRKGKAKETVNPSMAVEIVSAMKLLFYYTSITNTLKYIYVTTQSLKNSEGTLIQTTNLVNESSVVIKHPTKANC